MAQAFWVACAAGARSVWQGLLGFERLLACLNGACFAHPFRIEMMGELMGGEEYRGGEAHSIDLVRAYGMDSTCIFQHRLNKYCMNAELISFGLLQHFPVVARLI